MTVERKTRYSLPVRIAYDDGESFMTADVVNISETGVFLETVMPLKPGTRVTLSPLVEDELGVGELTGEVVRKEDHDPDDITNVPGMGIRFVDVDEEAIARLREHLEEEGEPTLD